MLLAGLVTHLGWHVACLAPLLIAAPFLREIQSEIEQRMVVARDITHKHADLAVVDFASVATPLAFDPDGMDAAFGETARIEGEDTIGWPKRCTT